MKASPSDPMLLAALTYAEQGFVVFPLSDEGIPLMPWANLTADYDETAMRFIQFESAGIGVRLGRESDLWLLDIDMPSSAKPNRANGLDSWKALMRENGSVQRTMLSSSPGGGYHIWFRYPKTGEIPNTVCRLGPSLDTKGERGMGILPPTKVRRGRYTLINDDYPALPPQWLVDLLIETDRPRQPYAEPPKRNSLGTSPYGSAALRNLYDEVATCPDGHRHKELNRACFALGQLVAGGEVDLDEAMTAMKQAGRLAGLPEKEVDATVRDGIGKGMGFPRHRDPR